MHNKNIKSGELTRRDFIKRAGITLGGTATGIGLFKLGKYLYDEYCYQQISKFFIPSYRQPVIVSGHALLTNLNLTRYTLKSYELYSLPFLHRTTYQIKNTFSELTQIIKLIKNKGKEPIILYDAVTNVSISNLKIFVDIKENHYVPISIYKKVKDFCIRDYTNFGKHLYKATKGYAQSISYLKANEPNFIDILEFAASHNIRLFTEHAPPEAVIMHSQYDYLIRKTIIKQLIKSDSSVLETINYAYTLFNTASQQREAQVLERGFDFAQEGFVPIIMLGKMHNLKKIKGAYKLTFLDNSTYFEFSKNPYAFVFNDIYIPNCFLDFSLKFKNLNFKEQNFLVADLGKKINKQKILRLLPIFKSKKYMLNKLTRNDVHQIISTWLYDIVDQKHQSQIWKYKPDFLK